MINVLINHNRRLVLIEKYSRKESMKGFYVTFEEYLKSELLNAFKIPAKYFGRK